MTCKSRLTALSLWLMATGALANSSADTVNERLPFSRLELEAQWQLDCAAAWAQLKAWQPPENGSQRCSPPDALQRDLQLCVFIYQPPGQVPYADCPDYRGALQRMESCAMLSSWLGEEPQCQSGVGTD